MLNKFEGKYTNTPEQRSTLCNSDKMAKSERSTQGHFGEPWSDGPVYKPTRDTANYLVICPDKGLETRIDRCINYIEVAQIAKPAGYLETHTLLKGPGHR